MSIQTRQFLKFLISGGALMKWHLVNLWVLWIILFNWMFSLLGFLRVCRWAGDKYCRLVLIYGYRLFPVFFSGVLRDVALVVVRLDVVVVWVMAVGVVVFVMFVVMVSGVP